MYIVLTNGADEEGFLNDLLQMRKWRFQAVNKSIKIMQLINGRNKPQVHVCQTPQSNHLHCGACVRAIKGNSSKEKGGQKQRCAWWAS